MEIKVFIQIGDPFVRVCCLNVSGMAFWGCMQMGIDLKGN